jgi:SAM-dependent methyltransferase
MRLYDRRVGDMPPHSAAYFGAFRDYWWNRDHLALCAERLGLGSVRSVLDVGAGVGHWGRALAEVLSGEARVTGIDREPEWVAEATRRADAAGVGDRFAYLQGEAERLPFEDATFDLVTCQTVLIHLPDPRAAIREMARVVRPGGLVLAAEPNNRALALIGTSVEVPVEELVDLVRFIITCERGKVALGLGDSSVGDLVPGLFAECGLEDVRVYQSDKPSPLFPPYAGEEQRVLRDQLRDDAGGDPFGWSRDEALRYFVAGGGAEADFDAAWERRRAEARELAEAAAAGTLHEAGGQVLYLVSGRRPA